MSLTGLPEAAKTASAEADKIASEIPADLDRGTADLAAALKSVIDYAAGKKITVTFVIENKEQS